MERETVRHRLYAVRLALGDGWKNPMPGEAFAALLSKRLKRRYDAAMISRMENGDRKIGLEEVEGIAALDPKGRGRAWLAFGEEPAAPKGRGPMGLDWVPVDAATIAEATRSVAETQKAKPARPADPSGSPRRK